MVSAAELQRDEAPVQGGSGRGALLVPVALAGTDAANDREPDVLAEIAGEVCGEVWELVRAISPLQGGWLSPGLGQLGAALMTAARWQHEGERAGCEALRARWPELVPGHAAMGRLVGLMVDRICR